MGIADFFRPKHRHSDTRVRAEAVRALTADDAAILLQIAKTDQDVSVRRIAIEKIDAPDQLAEISKAERERALRDLAGERAAELWVSTACAADDDDLAADNSPANAAFAGLLRLGDQRAVAEIAARAASSILRKRALAELHDAKALAELAKKANAPEIRLEAVSRIDDPDVLRALATDTTLKEVGLAAVEQLDDPARLEIIAQKAKNKAVRQRARKIVGEMEAAERSQHQTGSATPKVSDDAKRRRAEKAQLMRDVENVVESFDFVKTEIIVRNAQAAFAALGGVEDDAATDGKMKALAERYWKRHALNAEQNRASNDKASARARRMAEEDAAAQARREAAEVAKAADAAEAEKAADPAELEARRAEAAQRVAVAEARRAEEAATRAARAAEDLERSQSIARSLAAMIEELEAMIAATGDARPDGRAIDRVLQQARSSFGQIGRVPDSDRATLAARYETARGKLVARIAELREAEDWARFANVPKAEALVAEAKALAEALAEFDAADVPNVGNMLKELQTRWKQLGPIPQNKSKELWEQFKAAGDAAYNKVRERRALDDVKYADNAVVKEKLIAEAESLADAADADMETTASRLKALQAEWKASGHVPRTQGDELWKRFRSACDRFFARRQPEIEARNNEQAANLSRKQALCAELESVVSRAPGDGGWGKTISEVRRLQAAWKEIGFVPRRDADAIYGRFRKAADSLFAKLDASRDEEANARRAEFDGVRSEVDAVIAADASADGAAVVARALAVRGKLREILGRDDEAGASNSARRGPNTELAAMMERMTRHVVATFASAIGGTELDPAAVEKQLADLVRRAEALLPKATDAAPAAETAPVDLAARLKLAMAGNAFGGLRFSGRDPVEIIDDLRRELAELGPVLSAHGEQLHARFVEVSGIVLAASGVDSLARRGRDDQVGDERGPRREREPRRERQAAPAPVSAAAPAPASAPASAAAPLVEAAPVPAAAPASPPATVDDLAGTPRPRSMSAIVPLDELDSSWDETEPKA